MQTVCTRLPEPYWQQVLDARSLLCEDPRLAGIFDPPTAHCTHVLAEDLDWEGLAPAISAFAKRQKSFELRTTGILCFTGRNATIVVGVAKDTRLIEYHQELYEIASRFAVKPDPSYQPDVWTPHVTIKRCGPNADAFGRAMAKLATQRFAWRVRIDHVSAQYDEGGASKERIERLRFALEG